MRKASIYLIPSVITENSIDVLPERTLKIIKTLKHYVVEKARTSRRFLRSCDYPDRIDTIEIVEIDSESKTHISVVEGWLNTGYDVGLLSEAGMPGVADPGHNLINRLHELEFRVIPLVGPSSIFLALAASGMNGQNFVFHGYLPIKEHQLVQKIKSIEHDAIRSNQTQIFIETPYRNDRMMKHLLSNLSNVKLCLASDITGQSEFIAVKTISEWRKSTPVIGKNPTIFLVGK